ncbi:response regulator [Paraburkholderia atlantica]|uniref:response regulator n=1 Tax=Paraburkholderia atlantica TaxID=2654982 RepID=UPI001EE66695|nr:response regulator [Paraburkholderia atlantica]
MIDDDEKGAEAIAALLSASRYGARLAVGVPAALAAMAAWMPEIALLDINMPGTDGFGFARQLRRDASTQHLVLLAFTAYDEVTVRANGIAAGFDGYCQKGAAPDLLLSLSDKCTLTPDALAPRMIKIYACSAIRCSAIRSAEVGTRPTARIKSTRCSRSSSLCSKGRYRSGTVIPCRRLEDKSSASADAQTRESVRRLTPCKGDVLLYPRIAPERKFDLSVSNQLVVHQIERKRPQG